MIQFEYNKNIPLKRTKHYNNTYQVLADTSLFLPYRFFSRIKPTGMLSWFIWIASFWTVLFFWFFSVGLLASFILWTLGTAYNKETTEKEQTELTENKQITTEKTDIRKR